MTTAFAEAALSWATAQGATPSAEDGVAGPTEIGIAEVAAADGLAQSPRVGVVVAAGSATVHGSIGGAQVSTLSVRRKLRAGIPVQRVVLRTGR